MNKLLKHILTAKDNETYEIANIMWAIGIIVLVLMAVYTVYKTGSYPSTFGQDFALLNGGGAAGTWGRAQADKTVGG
jgi:hypothetical protein